MLVLHPRTLMEMDGPLGDAINVGAGVNVAVSVELGTLVLVAGMVEVAINGVEVFTPITTGVGVIMDGLGVEGKNGVDPDRGWMIQPLHEDNRSANRIRRIYCFIFFSLFIVSCLHRREKPRSIKRLSALNIYNCPVSPQVANFF